jgi:hypothetical protein
MRVPFSSGSTLTPKCLARNNKSNTVRANKRQGSPTGSAHFRARRNFVRANAIGIYIRETLRFPSSSRARFRRVGLACRARLCVAARSTSAAGVHIVLAKVRRI